MLGPENDTHPPAAELFENSIVGGFQPVLGPSSAIARHLSVIAHGGQHAINAHSTRAGRSGLRV
jgi:hypothetical protein